MILIGFASTGKTAVGRVSADKLGFAFVDLDVCVETLHLEEKGVGRRCREIYSLFGRDCFVRYETRALEKLNGTTEAVIAVGGGTPLDETNRVLIRSLGRVVFLKASPEAVFDRMKFKGFPQYLGKNPSVADVAVLTTEREPYYLKTADIVIDNSALSPESAADAVIAALANGGLTSTRRSPVEKDETQ